MTRWQVWKPQQTGGGWDVARVCGPGTGLQMVAWLHWQWWETQGNLLPLRRLPVVSHGHGCKARGGGVWKAAAVCRHVAN